jgi:hypothetical protein
MVQPDSAHGAARARLLIDFRSPYAKCHSEALSVLPARPDPQAACFYAAATV